jgi:hypothetical protein
MKFDYTLALSHLEASEAGRKIVAFSERKQLPLDEAIDDAKDGRLGADVAAYAGGLPSFLRAPMAEQIAADAAAAKLYAAGLAAVAAEQQRQTEAEAARAATRVAAKAHAAARAEIIRIAQTTSQWDDRVASWSRADLSRITPDAAFSETPTLWVCFLGGVRADVVSGEDWSHDLGMVGYGQWHLRPEWEQMTTAELVELAATLRAQLAAGR